MASRKKRNHALRVTFAHEGGKVKKVSHRRVEMTAPPSHELDNPEGKTGFWYELRDKQDKVIYRRVMHNPVQSSVEAFSPEGSITRHPVEQPAGVFQVTVPQLTKAASLVLVGSTHSVDSLPTQSLDLGVGPVRELARFNLKEKAK